MNSIEDAIYTGYVRLFCAIKGITMVPKRCRVCGEAIDENYAKRRAGYLCRACYQEWDRDRRRKA